MIQIILGNIYVRTPSAPKDSRRSMTQVSNFTCLIQQSDLTAFSMTQPSNFAPDELAVKKNN
jgi:hypothetical protein